jgi:parallel beta-helix repeat protein
MPGTVRTDRIEGTQDPKTVQIPTGTGNSDEWIQDLFTGRKRLRIYPSDLYITGQWVDACAFGDLGLQATIESALTDIGSDLKMLLLNPGTWNITSNLAIPSNVILWPLPGAYLNISSGVTLSVIKMVADRHKVFIINGTALVIGLSDIEAEWFGVSSSETAANNAIYMTRACYACSSGGTVSLTTPGTYSASAVVDLHNNTHIHLGMGVTWDISSFALSDRIAFRALGAAAGSTSLTIDHSAGLSALHVGTISGFSADQPLFIYDTTYDGVNDFSIVKSVTGTTITLKYPINYLWPAAAYVKSFTPKKDILITGPGWIVDDAATVNTALLSLRQGYRVGVENVRMRVYSATGNLGKFIEVSEADECVAYGFIRKCFAEGNPASGFHTQQGSFGFDIKENSLLIEDGTYGIQTNAVKHNVIGNKVNGGTNGIWVENARDIKVKENDVNNCTRAIAIYTTSKLNSVTVGSNIGRNCTTGLYVDGDATRTESFGIVVEPNNFQGCTTPYDIASDIAADLYENGVIVTPGGYPTVRQELAPFSTTTSGKTEIGRITIKGGLIPADGGFKATINAYFSAAYNFYFEIHQGGSTIYSEVNSYGSALALENTYSFFNDGDTTTHELVFSSRYGGAVATLWRQSSYFAGLDTDDDFDSVLYSNSGGTTYITKFDIGPAGPTTI